MMARMNTAEASARIVRRWRDDLAYAERRYQLRSR
jgi:hypothetical protein